MNTLNSLWQWASSTPLNLLAFVILCLVGLVILFYIFVLMAWVAGNWPDSRNLSWTWQITLWVQTPPRPSLHPRARKLTFSKKRRPPRCGRSADRFHGFEQFISLSKAIRRANLYSRLRKVTMTWHVTFHEGLVIRRAI
jgi:hypothetical protein